jgi:outer membrane protein OmpA-like peptidoglycan-associated protein
VRTLVVAALAALLAALPARAEDEGEGVDLETVPTEVELDVREVEMPVRELEYPARDLEIKVQDVEGEVQALELEETDTEVRIELSGDVLFDFDKATLRPEAEPILRQVADVIARYKTPSVLIEGYTDSKGSDAYNLTLSRKRAETVKAWLARNGVKATMTTKGWGEANPVAPNEKPDGSDDPEGRQKNRRVQVTVKKA